MQLDRESLPVLAAALEKLEAGFGALPPQGNSTATVEMKRVLLEVAERLQDNYPYFHPLYAGQMLKPPHPVARLAYSLSLWINPNNHALDGGRASSAMEKEAVASMATMVGWPTHLGHLCSGGTMANLEALWIASQEAPGKTILASSQAHYTHERLSKVLGLPFAAIPCDRFGRIDLAQTHERVGRGDVGTVVATIGTTAAGAVDPLPGLLELRDRYGFRLHADAAYGGYFKLVDNLSAETRSSFERVAEVDSIVIDPHKHGLQPYGCGCVLFRDPAVGRFYKHASPYTYFTSSELHLGEISLECSRPGAAAVALWATLKLLPLVPGGEFARMLAQGPSAATILYGKLLADDRVVCAFPPELDIVVWTVRAARVTEASARARKVFALAAEQGLHLALAQMPVHLFDFAAAAVEVDSPTVTCLRSVLMKPEHEQWLEQIWALLSAAMARA